MREREKKSSPANLKFTQQHTAPDGAQGARLDFGMHEHRLEFGIAERTTSTSAQHKFELESVGLVLGGPAGAAPSDVQ